MLTGPLYLAAAVFLVGVAWRVGRWAFTPEPFRIPTTRGQQRSIDGIRPARIESPSSRAGVAARVLIEVLLFRSLFRNTAPGRTDSSSLCPPPVFFERKALWVGAFAFHWSLLVIVVRHVRLFVEPVPGLVSAVAAVDGFFEVGLPVWYVSDVAVSAALVYLLVRRLRDPLLRYLSLPADYLALGTLLLVVGSGIGMRYVGRIDLVTVRTYTLGLAAFPVGAASWPVMLVAPASSLAGPASSGVGALARAAVPAHWWFIVHLLSASFLLAMLPFTKLMHAAGVWLSPTRNQANDTRSRRYVNPWNRPAPYHTYAEWEQEFRDKLAVAGLPIEKQTSEPGRSGP
jgi:nitrate reductase gamma subunit